MDGIPCTTVARTLLDLAEVVDRDALEQACERAETLERFDLREIEDVLSRAEGRQGAPLLRAAVAGSVADPEFDFLWPERRLIVEVDGWSTHGNRRSFRRDRRRDVDLEIEGYSVLRFTWEDVVLHGPEVVRKLRRRWFRA